MFHLHIGWLIQSIFITLSDKKLNKHNSQLMPQLRLEIKLNIRQESCFSNLHKFNKLVKIIQKINKSHQIQSGNKDLSWFTKSFNGFIKDTTSFQDSSKACLNNSKMSTRKINGFN